MPLRGRQPTRSHNNNPGDFSEVGWADFGNPRLNRDRHADTDRGVSNTKTPYCPCVHEEPHPT